MTVVIVEDEARILELCTEMLAQQGHEVHGFLRGEDALAFLATRRADVLVVDYRMPGMNGDEILQRARAQWPDLRAVMMTGQGTPAVLADAERTGFVRVVPKPFTPDQLVAAVAAAVRAPAPY